MMQTLKTHLQDLNTSILKDLQEKYGNAEVEIKITEQPQAHLLGEEWFWEIIAAFDWSQEGKNDDLVLKPAIEKLIAYPVAYVYRFQDILSEKLYHLDQQIYAEHIGKYAYTPDRYFSLDDFLYVRCCVVANGKAFYEKVLQDPTQMPKGSTYEALLYLAGDAYTLKTGKAWDYLPAFNYETYSNQEKWSKKQNANTAKDQEAIPK